MGGFRLCYGESLPRQSLLGLGEALDNSELTNEKLKYLKHISRIYVI